MLRLQRYYTISAEKYPANKLADYALYSLGWAAERQKDYQKAIGFYQRLLGEKKQSDLRSTTAVRIGECYSKSGQFQKSIDYLASAKPSITDSTEKAEADYCTAEDYYNLQDFAKARALYQEFCKDYPLNPLVRTVSYSIGWTYLKTNDFTKATAVFGDLAAGADDVAYNSLFREAQSVRLSGDTKKALEIFNQVITSRPSGEYADNALFESGMIHYEQKDYDAAISFFEQVPKKYPSGDAAPDAYRMLGESYIAKKNYEEAAKAFHAVKGVGPANDSVKGDAAFQEAWALYKLQKYSDAAALFASFLKEHPQHAKAIEAFFWAGESNFQAGQFADAEKYYGQFIKQGAGQPKIPDARYGLAWSYFKQGKYKDAAETFVKVLSSGGSSQFAFDAQLRLGDSYYYMKEYANAAGAYRGAIQSFPAKDGIDYAYYQLAQSEYKSDKFDTGIKDFEDLISRFPNSGLAAEAEYGIGWIYFQSKKYDKAIGIFQTLISRYPKSELLPKAYYSIGDSVLQSGKIYRGDPGIPECCNEISRVRVCERRGQRHPVPVTFCLTSPRTQFAQSMTT